MKHLVRWAGLLVVLGLAVGLAGAAELRMTGFIDNVFPHFRSNISQADGDFTRNEDQTTMGRTRGRMYFNAIASDNLRGVFGFEIDAVWGENPDDPENFDRNIDEINIKTKWLYVDFTIPQVPIGNRTRFGGMPLSITPLHSQIIVHGDSAAGDTLLTVSDQVTVDLFYTQFGEDSAADNDRFPGSDKTGESFATGMVLRLKPIEGLDLHLPFVYGHTESPFTGMTSQSGPFKNVVSATQNLASESRYYLGFDSRYRIGNTSIEPTFMYVLGSRQFTSASQALTGVRNTDISSYVANLQVAHTWGPWLFQGRVNYVPGNKANDDINNTGIGGRAKVKYYAPMNADGGPFWQEWFEVFGNSEVDGTSIDTWQRMSESGGIDRFGWASIASAVEYQLTDNLILEGAAGGFWAAQKPGCPSNLRVGSITGPCLVSSPDPNGAEPTFKDEARFNLTGNSRFLGWEVAAGVRYQILPGLTWTPRLAYADYGNGLNQNNRKAMDAWVFANRMIYIF
jgi:hypothetical protein